MRSGPGAVRTILLFHIISVSPSKQPRMVRTFLKVTKGIYGVWLLFFVPARTNKRHHHQKTLERDVSVRTNKHDREKEKVI